MLRRLLVAVLWKESARTHASVCIHVCIYVCERKRELVCVFLGEVVMTHMRKQ